MPGVNDPESPAAPDAILITVGSVVESQLKMSAVGNWSSYTNDSYKNEGFHNSKYTFQTVAPTFEKKISLNTGVINQIVILHHAQIKPPSPFKSVRYRPPMLSPQEVHEEQQRAVNTFALLVSAIAGPSNLPAPPSMSFTSSTCSSTKLRSYKNTRPEGSNPKHAHADEIAEDDNMIMKDAEDKDDDSTDSSSKGKGKAA
ncbi:hypothetical protein B0H19DRAFT_1064612 [Mycena capillaripes]|nr:hypothetical protein B0H19DRAFT_1064612 [Mycena capillaripes]